MHEVVPTSNKLRLMHMVTGESNAALETLYWLRSHFPQTHLAVYFKICYLEISPQYHSASFNRLLVSVRADGAIFDLTGFAGRTTKRHKHTHRQKKSLYILLEKVKPVSSWHLNPLETNKSANKQKVVCSCPVVRSTSPGGVRSCSEVLSINSLSTTRAGNSSENLQVNQTVNRSFCQYQQLNVADTFNKFKLDVHCLSLYSTHFAPVWKPRSFTKGLRGRSVWAAVRRSFPACVCPGHWRSAAGWPWPSVWGGTAGWDGDEEGRRWSSQGPGSPLCHGYQRPRRLWKGIQTHMKRRSTQGYCDRLDNYLWNNFIGLYIWVCEECEWSFWTNKKRKEDKAFDALNLILEDNPQIFALTMNDQCMFLSTGLVYISVMKWLLFCGKEIQLKHFLHAWMSSSSLDTWLYSVSSDMRLTSITRRQGSV